MDEGDGLENRRSKDPWVRILPPPPRTMWRIAETESEFNPTSQAVDKDLNFNYPLNPALFIFL